MASQRHQALARAIRGYLIDPIILDDGKAVKMMEVSEVVDPDSFEGDAEHADELAVYLEDEDGNEFTIIVREE